MPRIARIVVPGIPHHITQRGNNKQPVFDSKSDYQKYCRWINKYASSNDLEIIAYCLMPNHVHFIAVPKAEESLSKTLQIAHMRYAQYMHGRRGTSGHLWQGRFYSIPMSDAHLYRAIRYVERNPVRSGLAKKPWDYPWSSACWHVGQVAKPEIHLSKVNMLTKNDWAGYLLEEDVDFKKGTDPY